MCGCTETNTNSSLPTIWEANRYHQNESAHPQQWFTLLCRTKAHGYSVSCGEEMVKITKTRTCTSTWVLKLSFLRSHNYKSYLLKKTTTTTTIRAIEDTIKGTQSISIYKQTSRTNTDIKRDKWKTRISVQIWEKCNLGSYSRHSRQCIDPNSTYCWLMQGGGHFWVNNITSH